MLRLLSFFHILHDFLGQQLKSQSTSTVLKKNQSNDSLDEAPIMSTSMRSPPMMRKVHAPVQVPGFHRGSFTIPANNNQITSSSSSTGLRNRVSQSENNNNSSSSKQNSNNNINENNNGRLFHIESESEQVGNNNNSSASQRF